MGTAHRADSFGAPIVCSALAPSRAIISIGKLQLTMLGETEVRVLSQSSDKVPAIELPRVESCFVTHPQAR